MSSGKKWEVNQTRMALNPLHLVLVLAASAANLILTMSDLAQPNLFMWVREAAASTTADRRPPNLVMALQLAPQPAPLYMPVVVMSAEELAAAEPAATATPVPIPTLTPTPLPTNTPATVELVTQPAAGLVELTGLRHEWQTWNNCGPATLAMNMSYFGSPLGQADIGAVLRQFPDDKNVSPVEMAAYAQSQGFLSQVRAGGDANLIRTLLDNGLPVLVETWLEEEPNNGMGHYRLITGYDDARASWIAYDSYVHTNLVSSDPAAYRGIYMPYEMTDRLWAVFNRTYVLVYPQHQQAIVQAILGESMDETVMWQQALAQAQTELDARPDDPFAWFNLGTNLVELGDYAGAALAYDRARAIGLPWRMMWYQFGPLAAYSAVGRHQDVIALADATLAVTATIEELYYWKGQALLALGDTNGAVLAWQRALELNPGFAEAQAALESTTPRS
jgi:tetratricopeptide (TPR) repeat protein